MNCRSIVSLIYIVGFISCNSGGDVNSNTENSIMKSVSVVDANDSVSLQDDIFDDDDEFTDDDVFFICKRVSKDQILKSDINLTEIVNFPESLKPDDCKQVYFGVDSEYENIYRMFYVFYGYEKDSFSIAYKVKVEKEKSFLPATCYAGSSVSYEKGFLTRECEENSNVYKLRFLIQDNKMLFVGDESENPNESLYKDLEEAEKKTRF